MRKVDKNMHNVHNMKIDKNDSIIIDELRKNARLPIKEIAKKTSMRPSTVHQRIRKLVDTGVIENFTIKLDDKAIGKNFVVFMLVKGEPSMLLDKRFINERHVKEMFGVTGEYDLLLKLKFRDVEEFNDFVINFRQNQKDVKTTMTMVATAKVKEVV